MRIFLKVAVGAGLLAGLVGCGLGPYQYEVQNLPWELGKSHEAPAHVSDELLAECTNRLKSYEKKYLTGSIDRYEQTGPLRFNPGFTCHAAFLPPSGYKLKSYTAAVVKVRNGVRETNPPSHRGKPFLLCEFAQVKGKVVVARWHVGTMRMIRSEAARCGLR